MYVKMGLKAYLKITNKLSTHHLIDVIVRTFRMSTLKINPQNDSCLCHAHVKRVSFPDIASSYRQNFQSMLSTGTTVTCPPTTRPPTTRPLTTRPML
jgi:hypothetical protein